MERVRREIVLGSRFDEAAFAAAFQSFRKLYNADPQRILCAPDVLGRFCELFVREADASHARSVRYAGIPLAAAILAAGTLAIEGEVSEDRMGDW
jgi:hypothetical protein